MVEVIKPHGPVRLVWSENITEIDDHSIQLIPILSSHTFLCNKTIMTSVSAIIVDGVTCEFMLHNHPQTEKHPHSRVPMSCHAQMDATHSCTLYHKAKSRPELFIPLRLSVVVVVVCKKCDRLFAEFGNI
jgi:hypothetical protein